MRRVSPRWARTLSIAGLSIFAAAPLAAQGATLTGRITETGSGQPIQEARVIVLGTSLFTTSGQDGKYTVRNVPAGTAEIRVIRVGFSGAEEVGSHVSRRDGDARLRDVAERSCNSRKSSRPRPASSAGPSSATPSRTSTRTSCSPTSPVIEHGRPARREGTGRAGASRRT